VIHVRDRLQRFLNTSGLTRSATPRPTLLAVRRDPQGRVAVAWRAAATGTKAWRVRAAGDDGSPGAVLAEVGPDARTAAFAASGAVSVTVVAVGPDDSEGPASSAYATGATVANKRRVLVVDGFRRRTGRYTKETHPFAAM